MYLDYFGLCEHPFNITPSPRFLYMTDGHRQALEHLLFGIRNRKGFIVLTGDVGTGKTTLCRALLLELGDDYRTGLILNPCLSETQFLRAILAELGVGPVKGDRLTLRDLLNRWLLDQVSLHKDVVLIIDEAQHLSLTMLEHIRLLSNLETDDRKLLQIVLVGQPELAAKLNDPRLRQLRQRIAVRFALVPLSRDETEGYIRHRLNVAGGGDRPTFERDAVGTIHERASGIPRLINSISDMSLLAAYAGGTDCVTMAHVRSAAEELEECLA
ncbi:MAG: AAA family ATPase [Planctomycetes bacterium]|nr:AAA family ATPase [Planctomycetota bacterium]